MIFFRRNQEKTPIEVIKEDIKKRKSTNKGNVTLTKEDKALIQQIKKQTIEWNKIMSHVQKPISIFTLGIRKSIGHF